MKSCLVDNGSGQQAFELGAYGSCKVASCNSGYQSWAGACTLQPTLAVDIVALQDPNSSAVATDSSIYPGVLQALNTALNYNGSQLIQFTQGHYTAAKSNYYANTDYYSFLFAFLGGTFKGLSSRNRLTIFVAKSIGVYQGGIVEGFAGESMLNQEGGLTMVLSSAGMSYHGYLPVVHEFGHVMGLLHTVDNDPTATQGLDTGWQATCNIHSTYRKMKLYSDQNQPEYSDAAINAMSYAPNDQPLFFNSATYGPVLEQWIKCWMLENSLY